MTEQTKTRIPAPLYAAAGAGDLAYQQLRKLPAVVTELGDKAVASLRTAEKSLRTAEKEAGTKAVALRDKAVATDLDKLRDTATASAVAFAQLAQDRALAVYTALVARGERVVGTGVVEAADVVNADMEATEDPKAVEAQADEKQADAAEKAKAVGEAAAKPRKRATTRPAAK